MPDTEHQTRERSAVRRALAMIADLEARLAAATTAHNAPVAVIGLGCRFPGSATDGDAYWRLLADGQDAITEVPSARWEIARYYDPDPDRPGKTNSRWGGFVSDVDMFDAGLFGISRREAEAMDPQHRFLLEVAWEALEHAGIAPDALAGSATGVFVGLSTGDYGTLLGAGRDPSWIDAYASLGNAPSISAGRLAYAFGTQGPAMVVDTACSSSLVAVHLAMQALRARECSLALAGGVNLTLAPELTINFSKARMLSSDGRCKTFDAAADGYVRGEGCGVVVLKLLSEAEASGDRVLAVLRGSAVNQDGRSAGLTAPNGPAQEAVIRAALGSGGVAPDEVDYIEAHGTGTQLGDPIEMHALKGVFGGRQRPLWVGSVKSNIGHTEAAAGIAGLIKAVLMLRHGAVPASLHFHRLNPHIELDGVPIAVPTGLQAAPDLGCIGVSSFGFSGTNAHVVVGRAAAVERREDPRPLQVLPLSARDGAALAALREAWAAALTEPAADYAGLCHVARAGRAQFGHRVAVVAGDAATACAALADAAPGTTTGTAGSVRVGFLVTGQGSNYAGMASGLAASAPVFAEVIERCDAVMGLDRRLLAVFEDGEALARTEYAQPALYALAAGLGALWRSWGIEPVAVLGHSLGEFAAAHLAGVFGLEEGARLVAARGRLMGALPAGGGMAALLGAGGREVVARHPGVELAGINSRTALTVAGPAVALESLLADPELEARGILAQRLDLGQAFHSRLMEPALDDLERAAAAIPHRPPQLPVVGSLTGAVVTQYDASYWRAHARQPVRFAEGLASLAALGCTHLVELGAQPVLCGFARVELPQLPALPSLMRPRADEQAARQNWVNLSTSLAQLWCDGAHVDWAGYDRPYCLAVPDAPTYPFQRQRYWFAPAPPAGEAPCTEERIELASGAILFRSQLDAQRQPFLLEHTVLGETIVPGASHLTALLGTGGMALRDMVFAAPLRLPLDGCNMQILQTGDRIELFADAEGSWRLYASAMIEAAPSAPPPFDIAAATTRLVEDPSGPAVLYAMLAERGIVLGPAFQGLGRLFRGDGEALAEIASPGGPVPGTPLHPAQLDAAFQALGAAFGDGRSGAFMPVAVDRITLHRPHTGPLWAHVRARLGEADIAETATGDVTLIDAEGSPIATVAGLVFKRIGSSIGQFDPAERWTYQVEWSAIEDTSATLPPPAALAASAAAARDAALPPAVPGLAEGLERLAGAYAASAGAEVSLDEVIPVLRRLYHHLPTMSNGTIDDPESLAAELSRHFGDPLEISLARRSGRALPQVLRGQEHPLAALFTGADSASVYSDPPFARMLNAMIVAALRDAAEVLPPGRPLRIIEVGAGTGAVFGALCTALPAERIEFTFTDISPVFLDAARTRFGGSLAGCALLDIEQPPERQGFSLGGFDAVVIANVLHATRDLRDSIRHAARFLAPNGMLLLLETVRRSNWSDLVFGSTPGWWRFADTALRPEHPLLGEAQWRELLAERFAEIATVDSPGGQEVLAVARALLPEREMVIWEADPSMPALDLADAVVRTVQDVLARPVPPALHIVTRGAQPIGTAPIAAEQSVVLGLGRVIALEHPELDLRLVDLPPGMPAPWEGGTPSGSTETAWRNGRWHVPRLVRTSLPSEPRFAASGTQLVTGGLGGLGPRLAEWLRRSGAGRVVLMGRSARPGLALPPGVEVMLGNVAERGELARVIAAIDAAGPPLRGVFHLAGMLNDAAVLSLTRDDLERVFAAKVTGARNLDAVVGARPLDSFVLFGSSVGLIGNAGQAAHAAANAYLAALAQDRQHRGLAGLCIDWGAWGEAGTLTRSSIGERLVAAGAALMSPDDAVRALGRAIVSGKARIMIAALDWTRFLAGYGGSAPLFFADVAPTRSTAGAPSANGDDPRASRSALGAFVTRAARRVLHVGGGEVLAPDLPLNEAGLDSLMALELSRALAQGIELGLPATLLFNFPTIDALTEHLSGLIGLGDASAASESRQSPAVPEAIINDVMQMTEAEMAAVIAREFTSSMTGRD